MSDAAQGAAAPQSPTPSEASASVEAQSTPEVAQSQEGAPVANLNEGQQEAVEQAIAEGASAAEVKQLIKEFKLKVNGKEVVKKYKNDEELIRDLQLGMANQGGMAKARELEKLYEKEIKRLQQNPWEVLQELGHDPLKLSESKLQEWVEEQKKSPEQVEFEKMQRELQSAREELKRQKEESEQSRMTQLQKQAAAEIDKQIQDELSAHKTLPNSRKTVSKIADALLWAMENGFPDATVKDVIPMVEQDIRDEMNEFVTNLPEEVMEQYFGQKNIERLRKKRIAQARAQATNAVQMPEVSRPAQPKEEKQKISARDFFKNPLGY